MRWLLFFFLLVFPCAISPAGAQLLSPAPRCITLVNQSGYTALGSVSTTRYVSPDGVSSYHRQNFRMADQSRNKFCSTGPFYPGYGVEVQLRSLIPLWTCIVPANGQTIRILSRQEKEDDPVRLYMECDPL